MLGLTSKATISKRERIMSKNAARFRVSSRFMQSVAVTS
jgi:hypothetical protein